MGLEKYSTENLKKELLQREKDHLDKALLETLKVMGLNETGPKVSKKISNALNVDDLYDLIYGIRFHFTKSGRMGGPEFVEMNEYSVKLEEIDATI